MGARQRHWKESRGRSCQVWDGAHWAGTARAAQQHPTALRRRGRGSVARLEVQELGCVPSSSQSGRKKLLPLFLRRKFLSQKRGAARSHALVQSHHSYTEEEILRGWKQPTNWFCTQRGDWEYLTTRNQQCLQLLLKTSIPGQPGLIHSGKSKHLPEVGTVFLVVPATVMGPGGLSSHSSR